MIYHEIVLKGGDRDGEKITLPFGFNSEEDQSEMEISAEQTAHLGLYKHDRENVFTWRGVEEAGIGTMTDQRGLVTEALFVMGPWNGQTRKLEKPIDPERDGPGQEIFIPGEEGFYGFVEGQFEWITPKAQKFNAGPLGYPEGESKVKMDQHMVVRDIDYRVNALNAALAFANRYDGFKPEDVVIVAKDFEKYLRGEEA